MDRITGEALTVIPVLPAVCFSELVGTNLNKEKLFCTKANSGFHNPSGPFGRMCGRAATCVMKVSYLSCRYWYNDPDIKTALQHVEFTVEAAREEYILTRDRKIVQSVLDLHLLWISMQHLPRMDLGTR